MSKHIFNFSPSKLHTPRGATRLRPPLEEMHPSKVQQSTAKEPDSGLQLGFVDIDAKSEPRNGYQNTPTKSNGKINPLRLNPLSSKKDDQTRYSRREAELGPEAQKMMDDLREEAAAIKAKLMAEREEELRRGPKDRTIEPLIGVGGRKIAVPKGKKGRFSDVHMAEFKKMDSIAGHPSAYRAQPGRFEAVKQSLKRSKSQAKLDEPSRALARSKSNQALKDTKHESASPAKKMKQAEGQESSLPRPPTRRGPQDKPSTPSLAHSGSTILTPTKASLARSESIKHPKSAMGNIPRSASSRTLKVFAPRTEGSHRYLSSLGNLTRVKSFLQRPQLHLEDPAAVAVSQPPTPSKDSTTAVSTMFDLNKELPSIPSTPKSGLVSGIPRMRSFKAMGPSLNTLAKARVDNQASPDKYTALLKPRKSDAKPLYPELTASTVSTPQRPTLTPKSRLPRQSGPPEFTIKAEAKLNFGNSPPSGPTIRKVRPSIIPGAFPESPKELPAIPHGITNKKRHRDDSEDEENRDPSPKKVRTELNKSVDVKKVTTAGHKHPGTSKGARVTSAGRKIMSMSRLNMLARPKNRK